MKIKLKKKQRFVKTQEQSLTTDEININRVMINFNQGMVRVVNKETEIVFPFDETDLFIVELMKAIKEKVKK